MKIYEKYINTLREYSKKQSEERFVANQLLEMHTYASSKDSPLIVELGVDKGQSTKVQKNFFLRSYQFKKTSIVKVKSHPN